MNRAEPGGLDVRAVTRGAVTGLCWVVPATVLNAAARAADADTLVYGCFLLILLGFAFAGFVAARPPCDRPLQHAAAAGLATFGAVQGVLIVIILARGDTPTPVGIVFLALLAACSGMLGGLLAGRSPRPATRPRR